MALVQVFRGIGFRGNLPVYVLAYDLQVFRSTCVYHISLTLSLSQRRRNQTTESRDVATTATRWKFFKCRYYYHGKP